MNILIRELKSKWMRKLETQNTLNKNKLGKQGTDIILNNRSERS